MSKILLLAGGTREESRNNKVATYVKEYFKGIDVACSLYDQLYLNTPFLLDYEDKQPESIIEIRNSLIDSKKIIIFSPVFNGGYVSHLKNTLDGHQKDLTRIENMMGSPDQNTSLNHQLPCL